MKKKIFALLAVVALFSAALFAHLAAPASALERDYPQNEIRYTEPKPYTSIASESFAFKSYEILEIGTTANNCPSYYTDNFINACGAVAGANIIGFYDKYHENLIPDYVSYYPANGKYKPLDNKCVPALIGELYTLMRTNVDDVGVSESDFKSGLSNYVSNHGCNLTFSSAFSNKTVDYQKIKNAINQNKVSVVFCQPIEIVEFDIKSNLVNIFSTHLTSNHIMVVYGYQKIKYVLNDNSVRIDTYLMVSSGLRSSQSYFLNINNCSEIDDLLIASIS